jgi:hypothetical protein
VAGRGVNPSILQRTQPTHNTSLQRLPNQQRSHIKTSISIAISNYSHSLKSLSITALLATTPTSTVQPGALRQILTQWPPPPHQITQPTPPAPPTPRKPPQQPPKLKQTLIPQHQSYVSAPQVQRQVREGEYNGRRMWLTMRA